LPWLATAALAAASAPPSLIAGAALPSQKGRTRVTVSFKHSGSGMSSGPILASRRSERSLSGLLGSMAGGGVS